MIKFFKARRRKIKQPPELSGASTSSPAQPDMVEFEREVVENPIVMSIFNEIVSNFISIDVKIVDKNGKDLEDHWLLKSLEQPDHDISFNDLKTGWLYNYYFSGECLLKKTYVDKETIMLFLFNKSTYSIDYNSGTYPYPITLDNKLQKPDDVIVSKCINPFADALGKSDGVAKARELSPICDLSKTIFKHNIKRVNDSMMKKFLIANKVGVQGESLPMSQMEAKQLQKEISDFNTNGDKLFVKAGIKLEVLNIEDEVELDFNSSLDSLLKLTCNVMNVPLALITSDNSTYNNVKEMKSKMYQDTIIPLFQIFVDSLNRLFKEDLDENKIVIKISDIKALQEDQSEQIAKFFEATKNNLTINEQNELATKIFGIEFKNQSKLGEHIITSSTQDTLENIVADVEDIDFGI